MIVSRNVIYEGWTLVRTLNIKLSEDGVHVTGFIDSFNEGEEWCTTNLDDAAWRARTSVFGNITGIEFKYEIDVLAFKLRFAL